MAGRPRDPDLENRLLTASWEILTSEGYDALTMTKVAARAKAHRTDVYRRWSSKARLVTDVLAEHLPPVREIDNGSLHADLRAYIDDLAVSWSSSWIDGLVGLLADLRREPEAEMAFLTVTVRRGQALRSAMKRAVERGELDDLPDPFLIGELVEGPLMHCRLIGRRPLTPEFLDKVAATSYRLLTGAEVGA